MALSLPSAGCGCVCHVIWPLLAGESSGSPRAPRPAGGRKPSQAAGSPPDRMPPVEVPANEHAQAGAAAPAPLLVDLQHHAIEHERVVPRDAALFLVA